MHGNRERQWLPAQWHRDPLHQQQQTCLEMHTLDGDMLDPLALHFFALYPPPPPTISGGAVPGVTACEACQSQRGIGHHKGLIFQCHLLISPRAALSALTPSATSPTTSLSHAFCLGHMYNQTYMAAARFIHLLGVGRTTESLNQGTDCFARRIVPFLFSVVHDALACFKVHFFHAELRYKPPGFISRQIMLINNNINMTSSQ